MAPSIKGFKDYKKFFVICVIVKFYSFKYTEVKCNQVYFFFSCHNQQYGCKEIVQGIGFHNYLGIRDPVGRIGVETNTFLKKGY